MALTPLQKKNYDQLVAAGASPAQAMSAVGLIPTSNTEQNTVNVKQAISAAPSVTPKPTATKTSVDKAPSGTYDSATNKTTYLDNSGRTKTVVGSKAPGYYQDASGSFYSIDADGKRHDSLEASEVNYLKNNQIPYAKDYTPATQSAPAAPTAQPPMVQLQPGSTDTKSVKALQDYLVSQGLMTQAQVDTGYGTYGPQTTAAVAALQKKLGVDNSTGVGYFGPRTISALGAVPAPTVSAIGNPADAPQVGGVPTLPVPQAASTLDTYTQSVTAQVLTARKALEAEALRRAGSYDKEIAALDKQLADFQDLQDAGLGDLGDVTKQETADKKKELDLARKRFDENYNANQALINEMDGLLTEGNQIIQQMRDTTGLASIMQPRIAKTMTDVAARTAVIQAVLSARNGQIGLAQNQLASGLSAIESIANDQLDYYRTVVDFYQGRKAETGDLRASLSKEQKAYADLKIGLLEQDLESARATSNIIKEAMLDPDTALAYASAGISLTDPPQAISQKLATYAKAQEMEWSAPYLLGGDYVQRNKRTGETRISVNVAAGSGGGSSGDDTKPLSVLDVARYNDLYPDAGVIAGDSEAVANSKVAAGNSPEAKTRNLIIAARDNGSDYNTVVTEINGDTTIKDKASALAIAKEVYGVTDKPVSPIEQRIMQMSTSGILTAGDKRAALKAQGFSDPEIASSSVGSWTDKLMGFLFK